MHTILSLIHRAGWPLPLALGALLGASFAWYGIELTTSATGLGGLLGSVAVLRRLFKQGQQVWLYLAFALTTIGFYFYAGWFNAKLAPPEIPVYLTERSHWYGGQILSIERQPHRERLVIVNVQGYGNAAQYDWRKLRLTTSKGRFKNFQPGDWVSLQAKLIAPQEPQFPGDFDGAAYRMQQGYSATGILWGKIRATYNPAGPNWRMRLNQLRTQIAETLKDGTQAGALAAALTVGDRSGLSEEVREHFRNSGLAHLLAISGLHVGLVGGFFYALFRILLARWQWLVLRTNIRTIAAIAGLVTAFAYMFLAGLTIPTIRAGIMLGAVFLAYVTGRLRQGLRLLALAALIMLVLWPPVVASASFQLSFAATLGLLFWAAQDMRHQERQEDKSDEPYAQQRKGWRNYVRVLWATGVVGSFATFPLTAMHFQEVSLAGLLFNLPAIPLTGVLVLPAGIILLASMPLGLSSWLWHGAQWPFVGLLKVAEWGAHTPLSGLEIPGGWWIPVSLLAVLVLACYILRVWRLFWATLVIFTLACVAIPFWPKAPQLHEFRDGATVILQLNNQHYWLLRGDGTNDEEYFLSRYTQQYSLTELAPSAAEQRCDDLACRYVYQGKSYLVIKPRQYPLAEDCARNDVILAPLDLPVHMCTKID